MTNGSSSKGKTVLQTMTGGEAVVEMLMHFGVDTMFGLPGDQTDIYDALYRRSGIRHILVRHEQAAAHMADAYARATGKAGVCDAAVGPGATNLISGIAEAFTSGIPVVALVSDIRTDWRGRGCFQEIDQLGVFKPITKEVFPVDQTELIPELMARAFQVATTGRPGPVLLNFPLDILKNRCAISLPDTPVCCGKFPPNRPIPPREDIAAAAETLLAAKRPVILAGGGSIASGAMEEVRKLAELLGIPVATTFMGKGIIAENHPLSLGTFGLLGRPVSNEYILNADYALAVGTRFTNVDTAAWRVPGKNTQIIQIDIEPSQIGRNYPVCQGLAGDAKAVLRQLLDIAGNTPGKKSQEAEVSALASQWRMDSGIESAVAQDNNSSPVHPLQVIRALQNTMNPEDALICDSGFNQIWGGQYFEVQKPGRNYMGPRGFGIMGFSLPAAISYSLQNPERRTVALCGDGGFAMVMQELETALRLGAPITVCIMNNSCLHFIKDNQRLLFDSRYISTEFSKLDYAAIARAFGCEGIKVEQSGNLEPALSKMLACPAPSVVDVQIRDDVVPDRISLQSPE